MLVATSAVRDADNGEAFLGEIEWSYGFTTRLLTGEEEAELTLRGVGEAGNDALVVDIGGGSTELIGGGHRISTELGSVRLTERFLLSDPPTEDELDALGTAVRSALAEVPETLTARRGIGVAGTITSLAALDLGLVEYDRNRVHGHRLGDAAVRAQLERLAALPLAERRRVPGLEPERAPVIVAGAIILREVMRHFGLASIEASERDILYGIALEAAAFRSRSKAMPRRAPTPAAERPGRRRRDFAGPRLVVRAEGLVQSEVRDRCSSQVSRRKSVSQLRASGSMAGSCHEAGISSLARLEEEQSPGFLPDRLEHLGRRLDAPLPDEVVPDRQQQDAVGGGKLLDGRGVTSIARKLTSSSFDFLRV